MSASPLTLKIKGLRDSLLVTLPDGRWEELRGLLLNQIQERESFFRGARLALDVGPQALHVSDVSELRDALSEQGVALWAVLSDSPSTEKTAQLLGLATRLARPTPEVPRAPLETVEADKALWVDKTLRSGMRVEYPGHIVVLGDVNPGAEIVAGGSVIVWGRLRGMVHAGAEGNAAASVCALDLSPQQLRIAGEIALAPKQRKTPVPEIVRLKDGQLVAEPWHPDKH